MATKYWIGGAPAIAQVRSYTFAGTWETDDIVRFTIGNVSVDVVVGSATISTLLDTLVAAWNALSSTAYPQFAEMTASKSGTTIFRLTADTAGKPFVVTLTPLETGGGAADAQTIEGAGVATTGTATTASSGPEHWDDADNWSSGTIPANTDTAIVDNTADNIKYGLDQTAVELVKLVFGPGFTGTLGLPKRNAGGYAEYRTDYLIFAVVAAGPQIIDVNCRSGRVKLSVIPGAAATVTLNVLDTGSPAEVGLKSLIFKKTTTGTMIVNAFRGSVDIGPFAGELCTITTLNIGWKTNQAGDVDMRIGADALFSATATFAKRGGVLEYYGVSILGGAGTFKHSGGELRLKGAGFDGGTIDGGTVIVDTAAAATFAATTATVMEGSSTLDFGQSQAALTVSTKPCITLRGKQAKVKDPFTRLGTGNLLTLQDADLRNVDLGPSFVLGRA